MDGLGIVYPQYWLQADYETSFPKHLVVIKIVFFSNKTLLLDGVETFVPKVLNASDLDSQHGMFKLTMKLNVAACMAPPFDSNPFLIMWRW
jgi:hypothetical protein